MIAADVMTRNVLTLKETSTIAQAVNLMVEHDIRHVPVVHAEGTLAGIVSERDLRQFHVSRVSDVASYEKARARLQQPVSNIMSTDVLTIDPDMDLAEVVDIMVEEKVGALPVVNEETDELVGIVSYLDVLRAARDSLADED